MSAADTCRAGHPRTPENIAVAAGRRYCRECMRERQRRSRAKLKGQPCRGCGRTGLGLDGGRHCSRCLKRIRQGRPLDGPPVRSPKATKPAPTPKPKPVASKLPKGWDDPLPPKSTRRPPTPGMSADHLDLGPIPQIPPDVSARCLRLLTRHDAGDLAVMLGVADEEPIATRQPEPDAPDPVRQAVAKGAMGCLSHQAADPGCLWCWKAIHGRAHFPDWTADGRCRRCPPRLSADQLAAEVERLLDAGTAPGVIADQLGYALRASLERRLDRIGRHDLARRLRPSRVERKAS